MRFILQWMVVNISATNVTVKGVVKKKQLFVPLQAAREGEQLDILL